MSKHHRMNSHRRKVLRWVIMWAQGCVCPHCGDDLDPDTDPMGPEYPTLDHLRLASKKGANNSRNILIKHRRCNEERGEAKPTQEDWHAVSLVQTRLAERPRSWQECEVLARQIVECNRAAAANTSSLDRPASSNIPAK